MTRDDPQGHNKTVDEAMAETTLFLNGFSKMSAFARDYNDAMLQELNNVQSKYQSERSETTSPSKRGGESAECQGHEIDT